MMDAVSILRAFLDWSLLAAFAFLLLFHGGFALMLLASGWKNARQRGIGAEDAQSLAVSRFTIPVSLILPVRNQENSISAAIRSLLDLDYPEVELIVVNDGSTDATMERLRSEFELKPRQIFYRRTLPTGHVRAIYRSAADPRLIVADADPAGRAHAMNCGVNLARYRYVCLVEADTVYNRDALLNTMGVVVRDPGTVAGVSAHVDACPPWEAEGPQARQCRLVAGFQHLERLRSFLKMRLSWGWSGYVVGGSFGFNIWRRDALIESGGFVMDAAGHEVDVALRLQRLWFGEDRAVRLLAVPEAVGIAAAPQDLRTFLRDQSSAQHAVLDTIREHIRLFGNPRYRALGLVASPWWAAWEAITPLVEAWFVVALAAAVALGQMSWNHALLVFGTLAFVMALGSAGAVLRREARASVYDLSDLARFLILAPAEILLYRPAVILARLKGTLDFVRNARV
jgi:glycosyltransferase involved in cell wall biosynthesis